MVGENYSMAWVCGIDPGVCSSFAFYNGKELIIYDIPTKVKNKNITRHSSMRKRIDVYGAVNLIRRFVKEHGAVKFGIIEDVHSMTQDGHVGAFTFGRTVGNLEAILNCSNIEIIAISPSVWKPQMGLNSDKHRSLALAKEKFPNYIHYFERYKFHNRAESALLAWLGYKKFFVTESPEKPLVINDAKNKNQVTSDVPSLTLETANHSLLD